MRIGPVIAAGAVVVAGCGGGSDVAGARAPVERYLAAVGRGDAPAACRELTRESRDQLAEFGHEHLRVARSCPAVFRALMRAPAGAGLRALGDATIIRTTIDGDRGEVHVKNLDRPIDVERDGDTWYIRSTPTGETD